MVKGLPEHLKYKNHLQEYTQKLNMAFPVYQTMNEGFQHAPKFRSSVLVDGVTYTSRLTFPHKKESEQDAAKVALECLQEKTKDKQCPNINWNLQWKSILYEFAVKKKLEVPKYTIHQEQELRPTFFASLNLGGKVYTGEVARSKKEAEQLAARSVVLELLESDSGLLRQIMTSKGKKSDESHKLNPPICEENNLAAIQKPVVYSPQPRHIPSTIVKCNSASPSSNRETKRRVVRENLGWNKRIHN